MRIKVTGHLDVEPGLVDLEHPSGLTQHGFEYVQNLLGLADLDTELAEDE